jgi:CysZ protein
MIGDIVNGISAYFGAWSFARKHRLLSYFLLPSLVSLLLGLAVLYLTYRLSQFVFGKIDQWLSSGFFENYQWVENILQWSGSVITAMLILLPVMFLFKYLVIIVNGPLMSPLSEKVEKIVYGTIGGPKFSIKQLGYGIFRGINFNLRLLAGELLLTLLIYLVTLPIAFLTPFILLMVQSYFAGRGNMDYAMERYYRIKNSLEFSKRYKGVAIGNGLPFVLLLYVPVIGFMLAPPLSTIAVTLETLKKIKAPENDLYPDR